MSTFANMIERENKAAAKHERLGLLLTAADGRMNAVIIAQVAKDRRKSLGSTVSVRDRNALVEAGWPISH